ncbi:MAG: hypothetical protein NTY53_25960, partial [Kiritimatiellaeota bacterium]|nr:hypothetical protein [Kiritimatiellota bacterium]
MKKKTQPVLRDLLDETATQIAAIYRDHTDQLDRNHAIGACLKELLDPPSTTTSPQAPSLYDCHMVKKLTQRVKIMKLELGQRKLYHCYRLAAVKGLRDIWPRIKGAGLSWRQVRDLGRLLGRGDESVQARTLASLHQILPRKPSPAGKRRVQRWLDKRLNPHRGLPDEARYIVLDRITGRV